MELLFLFVIVGENQSHKSVVKSKPTYKVEFYSYQQGCRKNPPPKTTHTFARFFKIENGETVYVDISWCPIDECIFGGTKRGRHCSIEESIAYAKIHGYNIRKWGPYYTTPEVFKAAAKQHFTQVYYNAFKSNCMHSVSDISGKRIKTGCLRGFAATEKIVNGFLQKGLIR